MSESPVTIKRILVPLDLNRLSDWLFTCARALNAREGIDETAW
jgi:cob(I)alamin adenosyltransferase